MRVILAHMSWPRLALALAIVFAGAAAAEEKPLLKGVALIIGQSHYSQITPFPIRPTMRATWPSS